MFFLLMKLAKDYCYGIFSFDSLKMDSSKKIDENAPFSEKQQVLQSSFYAELLIGCGPFKVGLLCFETNC